MQDTKYTELYVTTVLTRDTAVELIMELTKFLKNGKDDTVLAVRSDNDHCTLSVAESAGSVMLRTGRQSVYVNGEWS